MSAPRKRPELKLVQPLSSEGLVPPNDLDAERAVLSCVMLKKDTFELVAPLLDATSWYSTAHSVIWQAIERVNALGQPLDVVTIARRLQEEDRLPQIGGAAYLAQIIDATPAVAHVMAHANIVAQLAKRRHMIGTLQDLASTGYREVDNEYEWLEHVESTVGKVRREKAISEDVDIVTSKDSVLAMLDAEQSLMLDGKRPGMSTGLADIDAATGGIHRDQLTMISGEKKGFKTTLSNQLAASLSQHVDVIVIDGKRINRPAGVYVCGLEQPHEEYTRMCGMRLGGINRNKFTTGNAQYEDFDAARVAMRALDALPIRFLRGQHLTPKMLRQRVIANRAYFAAKGISLRTVIVDYVQLMEADPEWADPRDRQGELDRIGRELRNMSTDPELKGIAWIVLSQVNDDGELRGSRALAQHLVSWWHLQVDKSERARDTYRPHTMPAKLTIKVQRHGPSPIVVPLWCHSDIGAFSDGGA